MRMIHKRKNKKRKASKVLEERKMNQRREKVTKDNKGKLNHFLILVTK